jgi:hypothetical protein
MHSKLPLYNISIAEVELYRATLRRQVNKSVTSERLAGNDN